MKASLESYRVQRDRFLLNFAESLSRDERFVAGWLTGSISRQEEDSLSDLDLTLVVAEPYSRSLCRRPEQVSAQTSPDRYSLFSQFGTLALIHENNNNAPEGGTFTFVMYEKSAVMVDWVLIPQSKAQRPEQAKLLFDKANIPVAAPPQPESLELRKKAVAEQWAFFWMMAAVTIKYIARRDGVFAAQWIEHLHSMVRDTERMLAGEPWKHHRDSLSQLQNTPEKQIELLKGLCQKMQEFYPKVSEFTGSHPLVPLAEIAMLFSLVQRTPSTINNPRS